MVEAVVTCWELWRWPWDWRRWIPSVWCSPAGSYTQWWLHIQDNRSKYLNITSNRVCHLGVLKRLVERFTAWAMLQISSYLASKIDTISHAAGVRYLEDLATSILCHHFIIITLTYWQAQPAIWCCFGSCCREVEWVWRPPAASGGLQQHWEGDSCEYRHSLIPRPCPHSLGMRHCQCLLSVYSKCK